MRQIIAGHVISAMFKCGRESDSCHLQWGAGGKLKEEGTMKCEQKSGRQRREEACQARKQGVQQPGGIRGGGKEFSVTGPSVKRCGVSGV